MTEPVQFTMEQLLEEDGMDIRCGLPEALKKQLDDARQREQAAKLKERADKLVAGVAEYESNLARLRHELTEVLQEYARAIDKPKSAVPAV